MEIFILLSFCFFSLYFAFRVIRWIFSAGQGAGTDLRDQLARQEAIKGRFASLAEFNPTQVAFGRRERSALAIDEGRKKVAVFDEDSASPRSRVYSYSDVVGSEFICDDRSVATITRGNQGLRSLQGALLFGETGAVVGGFSGKSKIETVRSWKKVALRVTFNDTTAPTFELIFFENMPSLPATEIGARVEKGLMEEPRRWAGIFEVIMKQASAGVEGEGGAGAGARGLFSVADEIAKLAELRTSGALTEMEFEKQKSKLLSA